MEDLGVLLKQRGIRSTRLRLKVLQILVASKNAFSTTEMNTSLGGSEDRSTIYRILSGFYAEGIIERIVGVDGGLRYVYLPQSLSIQPSFRCSKCGSVSCLSPLPSSYLEEIQRHHLDNAVLVFSGTCSDCLRKRV